MEAIQSYIFKNVEMNNYFYSILSFLLFIFFFFFRFFSFAKDYNFSSVPFEKKQLPARMIKETENINVKE